MSGYCGDVSICLNYMRCWSMYKGNLIKETSLNVHVVPKLLNLDFGLDFQIEMVKAAKCGGVDGAVIANRFFRRYVVKRRVRNILLRMEAGS